MTVRELMETLEARKKLSPDIAEYRVELVLVGSAWGCQVIVNDSKRVVVLANEEEHLV